MYILQILHCATMILHSPLTKLCLHGRQLLLQARHLLLEPSDRALTLRNSGLGGSTALLSGRLLSGHCSQRLLVPRLLREQSAR